jgi:hypothetical protein
MGLDLHFCAFVKAMFNYKVNGGWPTENKFLNTIKPGPLAVIAK